MACAGHRLRDSRSRNGYGNREWQSGWSLSESCGGEEWNAAAADRRNSRSHKLQCIAAADTPLLCRGGSAARAARRLLEPARRREERTRPDKKERVARRRRLSNPAP